MVEKFTLRLEKVSWVALFPTTIQMIFSALKQPLKKQKRYFKCHLSTS